MRFAIPVAFVFLALLLTGCNEGNIVLKKEYVVVTPPQEMFECPIVKKFPDPITLTDIQVARLLKQLHKNNRTCAKNMELIDQFLEQAEKDVAQGKKITVE